MISSRYNLITKIDDNNYAIFNPLSGAFDIADQETKECFQTGCPRTPQERQNWFERGYFFHEPHEEEAYIHSRYHEFLKETAKNPVQFLLVETYACNFDCAYCYQQGIDATNFIAEEMIHAFIDYLVKYRQEKGREVFVSLFGGEPLLPGETARRRVELLVELLIKNGIGLAVVTNGYTLATYIDVLKKADLKEIHISLDGDKPVHDARRSTKDGQGSFDRILAGIRQAVAYKIPVHIRLIIDRLTLKSLPGLAAGLEQEGLLDLPKNYFKTSLGRNYELINPYMKKEDLFTMDEMIREYSALMLTNPLLKKLHVPSFFGITHMMENGEMYLPNFDACPATKSEFVFDGTGKIYGCTASCGREGYELGTYYPEVKYYTGKWAEWEQRSILSIEACRQCSVGVVCGGGCGVLAREKNNTALSPNCKPVKEIMDLGILYYKDRLLGNEV